MAKRKQAFVLPNLPFDIALNLRRAAAATALTFTLTTCTCPIAPAFGGALDFPPAPPTAPRALPAPQIDAEHALAAEAWGLIRRYFIDDTYAGTDWGAVSDKLQTAVLRNRPATYAALKDALKQLKDPYTRLLTPNEMRALQKFDVSGVGLLLTAGSQDTLVVATTPAPGTPAAEAHIQRGDVLLAVEENEVGGKGAFEVAQLMQGNDGQPIKLKFRDAGDVVLIRKFIRGDIKSATNSFVVEQPGHTVGYIRLTEFRASARSDVVNAVRKLQAQGADAFVLDLRGNPGGVFEGALEIAGVFEGEGVPVAVVDSRADQQEAFKSLLFGGASSLVPRNAPLAIVVDEKTASASEVLAGGLRSACRAAIVGDTNTYGKGVIQGVFGLSDGSGLVITVAEYKTPKGEKIQGRGLKPDYPLSGGAFDRALRSIGIEGPAKIDWSQIESTTSQCLPLL